MDGLHISQPVYGGRILARGGCRNERDQQQNDGIHVWGGTDLLVTMIFGFYMMINTPVTILLSVGKGFRR